MPWTEQPHSLKTSLNPKPKPWNLFWVEGLGFRGVEGLGFRVLSFDSLVWVWDFGLAG